MGQLEFHDESLLSAGWSRFLEMYEKHPFLNIVAVLTCFGVFVGIVIVLFVICQVRLEREEDLDENNFREQPAKNVAKCHINSINLTDWYDQQNQTEFLANDVVFFDCTKNGTR